MSLRLSSITGSIAAITTLAGCALITSVGDLEVENGPPDAATSQDGGPGIALVDGSTIDGGGADCPSPVDPALIAYYRFEDGSGRKVKDCSGKGNDGTIEGSAMFTTGHTGGGLHFNGTSTCIDIGPDKGSGVTAFSVAAWVNVSDFAQFGSARFIAAKTSNSDDRGWRLASDSNGTFAVRIGAPGTAYSLVSPMDQPTGTWLHVGVVFVQGGDLQIFVGGAKVASSPAAPAIVEDTSAHLRVGCFAGVLGQNYNFSGVMDEVRIYSRGLTEAEMAALAL